MNQAVLIAGGKLGENKMKKLIIGLLALLNCVSAREIVLSEPTKSKLEEVLVSEASSTDNLTIILPAGIYGDLNHSQILVNRENTILKGLNDPTPKQKSDLGQVIGDTIIHNQIIGCTNTTYENLTFNGPRNQWDIGVTNSDLKIEGNGGIIRNCSFINTTNRWGAMQVYHNNGGDTLIDDCYFYNFGNAIWIQHAHIYDLYSHRGELTASGTLNVRNTIFHKISESMILRDVTLDAGRTDDFGRNVFVPGADQNPPGIGKHYASFDMFIFRDEPLQHNLVGNYCFWVDQNSNHYEFGINEEGQTAGYISHINWLGTVTSEPQIRSWHPLFGPQLTSGIKKEMWEQLK